MLIKNFDDLNTTPQRKICLELIESALSSIQPAQVFEQNINLNRNILKIMNSNYDLNSYENIYILGFGKGSSGNAKILEDILSEKLTEGFVIDTKPENFKKIQFTKGTHPVISQVNVDFTEKVINRFSKLTEKDLVFVIVCGGGSAMFEKLHSVSLEQKIEIEKALLKSGATIFEMNKIRQHLSDVKGGGLAKILYPATVATLIFSDVPGNDIAYIASGPTVKDPTTIDDAILLIKKFNIPNVPREIFIDNPTEDKYFEKVENHIVLSNLTALNTMKSKAEELGINAIILTDKFQDEAKLASKKLLDKTPSSSILLAGGETTVKVRNENGKGGRNQELVLGALPHLERNTTIVSFATDGWDNTEFAGAIGDATTIQKAKNLSIDPNEFLEKNDSFTFFEKTEDGIITGRLPSNVSDLMIILKK